MADLDTLDTSVDTLSMAGSRANAGMDTLDTSLAPARVGACTRTRPPARAPARARVSTGVHAVHAVHTLDFIKKNDGQGMDSREGEVSK